MLMQHTGAAEGFYRRNWQPPLNTGSSVSVGSAGAADAGAVDETEPPTSNDGNNNSNDNRNRTSSEEGHRRRSLSAPVRPETMTDRAAVVEGDVTMINQTATTRLSSPGKAGCVGALRPPGELGTSGHKNNNKSNHLDNRNDPHHNMMLPHPRTVQARQRIEAAARRGHALEMSTYNNNKDIRNRGVCTGQATGSLVLSFCYNGMEVVMAAIVEDPVAVYALCARTHLVFQKLSLNLESAKGTSPSPPPPTPETNSNDNFSTGDRNSASTIAIKSLVSHPESGQVCVALSDGRIKIFHPVATDPKEVCFGRYHWLPGLDINCALTFYDEGETHSFQPANLDSNNANENKSWLDLSLADDGKVLVAHRDQLAVFDGSSTIASPSRRNGTSRRTTAVAAANKTIPQQLDLAELLWTTRLPGSVVSAKISGDGRSIAVVLQRERSSTEDEEDAKAATDGVHTFEHDTDDGSQVFSSNSRPESSAGRPALHRERSLGILYKPGPFLVHSAAVTRLAFRGYGNLTSNLREGHGNDLLLTYCESDFSARIYGQNNWNPLTEWITQAQTFVDWVKCISAFSLGDLESNKGPRKKLSMRNSSFSTSTRGATGDDEGGASNDIQETLSKRLHFSSMPNQPTSSTNAGAWVVELTFHDPHPSLRLFRLTYLERGIDDLNPTLLEIISSFLPINCVFRDRMFSSNESTFSIEGIWPAWNAWLSQSTDVNTNDTLSGSAMAELGLSSGQGGAAGAGSTVGGMQNPPSELRIVSSHSIPGQICISEFFVLSDKALTSFELGNPKRQVLSVIHMNNCVVSSRLARAVSGVKPKDAKKLQASMSYDSSRLVAEVQDDGSSISIIWRKHGTMSFLPYNWLPGDVAPRKATGLLKNSSSLRDESLFPLPSVLPSVYIPTEVSADDRSIRVLMWWPDSKFAGSPLLVAVTSDGTVVVFEIPPPGCTLEPPFPINKKPPPPTIVSTTGLTFDDGETDEDDPDRDYEVKIIPDPEYGLGLRLESQADGMCAIAGSFKKHPLNGDTLPAEKNGAIVLGDELLSANGVDLEDKSFDDIVTSVREVGVACGPGKPIRMKFRRSTGKLNRQSSFVSGTALYKRDSDPLDISSGKRRTMEQIIGVNPENVARTMNFASQAVNNNGKDTTTPSVNGEKLAPSTLQPSVVSSVVAVFRHAVSVSKECHDAVDMEATFILSPLNSEDEKTRTSLLFWIQGPSLAVSVLTVDADCKNETANIVPVAMYPVNEAPEDHLCALHVACIDSGAFVIAVCNKVGHVQLISVIFNAATALQDLNIDFQKYAAFQLKTPWTHGSLLQIYSSELLVTAQPNTGCECNVLCVWSASPRTGRCLNGHKMPNISSDEYFVTEVGTDNGADGNSFLDFCIVPSGSLDCFPSLVTFSSRGATLFQRHGGGLDWLPASQIFYNSKIWSESVSSLVPIATELSYFAMSDKPRDIFAHLIPGLFSVVASRDETIFLRSDWHPDSLLAYICTDGKGASHALRTYTRSLFLWLCSEGRAICEGHMKGSLPVAPLCLQDIEPIDTPSASTSSENVISSFNVSKLLVSPDTTMLKQLQSAIMTCISSAHSDRSRLSTAPSKSDKKDTDNQIIIPQALFSMERDDMCILWALGETVESPPRFEEADIPSQLFLFASALFSKVVDVSRQKDLNSSLKSTLPMHGTVVRNSVLRSTSTSEVETIASAGALGALLCKNQSHTFKSSRIPDQKMTWTFARERRVAFWQRSDSSLALLSEEIGQNVFRETRDSMECALYFIAARKIRTLRNLAATDQSMTGSKFAKFLTDHDFSSERGRRAAEKNAFSLLRKCRYRVAAAFFLLANPPFLNSALETISTKMGDIDLAFLVGRLTESSDLGSVGDNFSIASSFGGFHGGGGGGYASMGPTSCDSGHESQEPKFSDWNPQLGNETRKLLVDRLLPASQYDCVLSAILLLWLSKKDEAAWFLSGNVDVTYAGVTVYSDVRDVPQRFFDTLLKPSRYGGTIRMVPTPISKANAMIDFSSSVVLLNELNSCSRVQQAAALGIARALTSRGAELSSIRTLLLVPDDIAESLRPYDINDNADRTKTQYSDHRSNDFSRAVAQHSTVQKEQLLDVFSATYMTSGAPMNGNIPSSFANDLGDKQQGSVPSSHSSGDVHSSIFDDFVAHFPARKSARPIVASEAIQALTSDNVKMLPSDQLTSTPTPISQGVVHSSIFDDFDVQPHLPAPPPDEPVSHIEPSTTCVVQSSIFDNFELRWPAVTTTTLSPIAGDGCLSETARSSIFDDFDVKPPVIPMEPSSSVEVSNTSCGVTSSIFNEFDVPVTVKRSGNSNAHVKCTNSCISAQKTNEGQQAIKGYTPKVWLEIAEHPTPQLWYQWKSTVLLDTVARRLLREVASVVANFHGDPTHPPIHDFYLLDDIYLSPTVSEVLQLPCDSESILMRVKTSLEKLSNAGKFNALSVVNRAIFFLGSSHINRILFSVLLHAAVGRSDLSEDTVRLAAHSLMQGCVGSTLSRDNLTMRKHTREYVSSQFSRREAASLSWQLESCLWFHRGGGFSLSGMAFNEAVTAIRIGLLVASWNRNFGCLQAMIQTDPDCLTDEDAGRCLWTSLKSIDSTKSDSKSKITSIGGWEFLVNCKRSQATELLRERPTGCFIIRPHSEDHGVFTISFKTNLIPDEQSCEPKDNGNDTAPTTPDTSGDELDINSRPNRRKEKKVRKDDVVQHAIIRLSDSGFRCGSFGPFTSLVTLLYAVSSSLPFKLRFDLPPKNRIITEERSQTSPNAVLLRTLNLRPADSLAAHPPSLVESNTGFCVDGRECNAFDMKSAISGVEYMNGYGLFAELVVLCLVRRQLSSVVTYVYDSQDARESNLDESDAAEPPLEKNHFEADSESQLTIGSRVLAPLLTWCRSLEIATAWELSPDLRRVSRASIYLDSEDESSDNVTESADAIEVSALSSGRYMEGGDSILRGMIQQNSGVEFSTLRLVEAGECTMLVLFSRKEAVRWLVSSGIEQTDESAISKLENMEKDRIIEPIDLSLLPLKHKSVDPQHEGVRYRFVDPWEVEALSNREGETRGASLGRGQFVGFSLGQIAMTTDHIFRELGGASLLELWTSAKGGITLTKALAVVHPPWERSANGDLQLTKGKVTEPPPLINSIRRSLYRNVLYRRLGLPQRFLALIQVELLDLKNLTSPGGSLSLTAYALLRLKRARSGGTLTNKARTLDSAATVPIKLNKTSGPNAPASWGSVVRFRFPLPEDASVDGTSYDRDRETLFKGPPRVLQVSVYEKKMLADHSLGTADISTDGLCAGGQLEEWVPLRSEKRGITWFARIRLTLRFELMCVAPEGAVSKDSVPSVGLQRIYELNQSGVSAHEDIQKRSMSSPDLLGYFEGIVY